MSHRDDPLGNVPPDARVLRVRPEATVGPRTSTRTWSKGSARGEGPQKKQGSVRQKREAGIDWALIQLHSCGRKMKQCPGCNRWICQATGHAKHVCGGAP
jgi:hypothetical protein